jgi:hypothetical protein
MRTSKESECSPPTSMTIRESLPGSRSQLDTRQKFIAATCREMIIFSPSHEEEKIVIEEGRDTVVPGPHSWTFVFGLLTAQTDIDETETVRFVARRVFGLQIEWELLPAGAAGDRLGLRV